MDATLPVAVAGALTLALAAAPTPRNGVIAFEAEQNGNTDVYTIRSDGSHLRRLTSARAFDGFPDWSSDGRRIVFESMRDGNAELYVMDADGSHERRLTHDRAFDGIPSWSPDGRRIAFESERDGNGEVYVMNADGSHARRLTHDTAFDGGPVWLGSDRLAFVSARSGTLGIYSHERGRFARAPADVRCLRRRVACVVSGRALDRICERP